MKVSIQAKRDPKQRRRRPGPLTKATHKSLVRLWKDATRHFILTTVSHVKVDTGMSAASLAPLGKEVGLKTSLIQSIRGVGPKPGHRNLIGEWATNNAEFKSKSFGVQLGESAYRLNFGGPQRPVLFFEFRIVVFQYYLHELGLVDNTSGPWGSLNEGFLAFQTFIENNFESYLPSTTNYLVNGEIG